MSVEITQVDSFTATPFRGNPAAVCILDTPADESWMQDVAREMNLSETAFVVPAEGQFSLRWFTPVHEVDLCGHGTLAAAHVLWERQVLAEHAPAVFSTRSGPLTARRTGDTIAMDFPATPATACEPPAELATALGADPTFVGRNSSDLIAEIESEQQLRELRPNFSLLSEIDARGVIVTAVGKEYDFVSRFFAPRHAINEDPVTGSAHCCLGPYWAARTSKLTLRAYQVSARGGEVGVTVMGDRVELSGQAITVFRGSLV